MSQNTFPPIHARGLVKRYGDLTAVAGIDLAAAPGTCLGLLGPNGAGKTTTIEVLEGLLTPDEGEVRILGRAWNDDGPEIRQRIGVQLQETRLPEKLTVRETLQTFRAFYREGVDPDSVMDLIGLREKRKARTNDLSGGQKQRLALGCALVSKPEVLFLDEPTTGLDPQARRLVWEIVEGFKGRGGTVLLTTHYMDEAEKLADDLIIVDHGKIIAQGTPHAIIGSLGADSILSFSTEDGGAPSDFSAVPGVLDVRSMNGRTELSVKDTRTALPALMNLLADQNVAFTDLHTHRPTLEDVFVSLTGRHLRDE